MGKVNLVLFEPEIPQNTANIMRTCLATNTKLHLIEPLGFSLEEKYLKRASANHMKLMHFEVYKNYPEFLETMQGKMIFLTRYGLKNFYEINFKNIEEDIYLVLGKESTGIPYDLLRGHLDDCYRLPMANQVRSLNLSNAAAIVVYEVMRQLGFSSLSFYEPENFKGKNFLKNI
ncbi:MAG TPA: tRNA (cytidine(34)-2'-O)-methyltransferase [Acholeplasmataceae bacterium]|jgi:tRNA (cytidine/uridine-2'-O-)-methyltransferase|nr:tRNA (cytidine(34)-2'-O)-methyltransferase [Acholeplasmataceae bacterium]